MKFLAIFLAWGLFLTLNPTAAEEEKTTTVTPTVVEQEETVPLNIAEAETDETTALNSIDVEQDNTNTSMPVKSVKSVRRVLTCDGYCGGEAIGCSCTDICSVYKYCCPDYVEVCVPKLKCGVHCVKGQYGPIKGRCSDEGCTNCVWSWDMWASICQKDDEGGYFGGGCFPEESEVTLQSGEVRSMKNLKIGDIIQTLEDGVEGKLISTPVIGFLDKRIYRETSYLVLKLKDERSISISVRHSIFIAGEGDQLKSVLAKDVNIGDDLFIPEEKMKVKSKVVDITTETKIGAYVPLTTSGTLIVDGVLVSCYTNTDHWVAHVALAPLRWFPTLLLDNELSQEKEGIRTIPRIIRDLGNKLGIVTTIDKQSNLIRDNSFVVDTCITTF